MKKRSLGLIETMGYTAAIEAADAATKSADVVFAGYEITLAGLVTVKFLGDVGAVKAAVAAGTAAAEKVGTVIVSHVIPRPDDQISRQLLGPTSPQEPEKVQGEKKPSAANSDQPAGKSEAELASPGMDAAAAAVMETTDPASTEVKTVPEKAAAAPGEKEAGTAEKSGDNDEAQTSAAQKTSAREKNSPGKKGRKASGSKSGAARKKTKGK